MCSMSAVLLLQADVNRYIILTFKLSTILGVVAVAPSGFMGGSLLLYVSQSEHFRGSKPSTVNYWL